MNYPGNLKFFKYGNIFTTNVFKKKYFKKYNYYKNVHNLKKNNQVKEKKKKICAMQIRNAPHFDMRLYLDFC